ncbi:MAG: HlyD family type I secretion periplasmic adaptor subunit [Sneathiella sp.]|nr:HlyD family type I secretion periplasmic adaptor subunit [Sneathiella sp.]
MKLFLKVNLSSFSLINNVFFLMTFGLVAIFWWMSLGTLDVVSLANGEVIPVGQVKKVQHLEGGIVQEILVREGETVTKGQAVFVLDSTQLEADKIELESRLTVVSVKILRLKAEISQDRLLKIPSELIRKSPEIAAQETDLFNTRGQRLTEQLDVQKELIAQKELQVGEIETQIERGLDVKRLSDEQIDISEKMLKNALGSRLAHISLLKEGTNLTAKIEQNMALLLQTRAALREANTRISMIKTIFDEDVKTQLSEAEQKRRELSQVVIKIKAQLDRMTLRAPVDGIVKALFVHSEGEVITRGGTVLEIVPAGDQLVIEALLPAVEIGFVSLDQAVQIRLASVDAGRFGKMDGQIHTISPDSFVDEKGVSFYKIYVTPKDAAFSHGKTTYKLSPGVQVICSIITDQRTILSYLFDPFFRQFGSALTER